MKHLKNENGNAAIFMLWLLGIVAIIFVLTINIVKVFIVKEHANLAVEQAALAGTASIIEKTQEAIEKFDNGMTLDPLYLADREAQKLGDLGKNIGELIEKKQLDYMNSGMDEADAFIKAANEILPERIDRHPYLKKEFRDSLGNSRNDAYYIFSSSVTDVIINNEGRPEITEMELSSTEWRVEVKSSVRFESISDNKFISKFVSDIPQKGYGPTLAYLENVYTGTIVFPSP